VHALPPAFWDGLLGSLGPLVLRQSAGDKMYKWTERATARCEDDFRREVAAIWRPRDVMASTLGVEPAAPTPPAELTTFAERAMYLDTVGYLPDDILTKVDRASMATSLEVRTPFLDRTVLAFAWRLPLTMKVSGKRGKIVLRNVLARYLPAEMIERPKRGFAVPVGEWLKTDLRDWAEDLLSPAALAADGLFNVAAVRGVWGEHLSGSRNWDRRIWTLLMFQAWRAEQAPPQSARPMLAQTH
jgi:asparagine synthase (glutamine-hydrolysing)